MAAVVVARLSGEPLCFKDLLPKRRGR
uniref:Uncharacterized protein n=1 Tax=Arundo donax TaxID=35708 RepID=A0A0A8ZFR9_ARUDO